MLTELCRNSPSEEFASGQEEGPCRPTWVLGLVLLQLTQRGRGIVVLVAEHDAQPEADLAAGGSGKVGIGLEAGDGAVVAQGQCLAGSCFRLGSVRALGSVGGGDSSPALRRPRQCCRAGWRSTPLRPRRDVLCAPFTCGAFEWLGRGNAEAGWRGVGVRAWAAGRPPGVVTVPATADGRGMTVSQRAGVPAPGGRWAGHKRAAPHSTSEARWASPFRRHPTFRQRARPCNQPRHIAKELTIRGAESRVRT